MMHELFLDANAHLSINRKALQALVDFNYSRAGHGHAMSPSVPGRAATIAMEEARTKIAACLGARSSDQIIFTSTCTQACEWAVKIFNSVCIKNEYKPFKSPTEHPAISQACDAHILVYSTIDIDSKGVIDVASTYKSGAGFICTHLQNEIGIIQPIEQIAGDYLLTDMSQSAGKLKIDLSRLPVDIAVFGAHKFGGPGNTGFMYLRDASQWQAFGTGSRYFTDRPGTPDVASVVATAVALEDAVSTIEERTQRMESFREVLEPGLKNLGFEIVSEQARRCPNTSFVSMPNGQGFYLMSALGERGIYVGLGSACGSLNTSSSPVMSALGYAGLAHDYIRISQWGDYKEQQASILFKALKKYIPR